MVIKIGINGFGRIGTTVFRCAVERSDIQVVAINDPFLDLKRAEYLMRYDSTRGTFDGEIAVEDSGLIVRGNKIKFFSEKQPAAIPWSDADVEYVVDSTGIFVKAERAKAHLTDGVKKVIICSPSVDAPMFVYGVNEKSYDSTIDVLSCASCTTNAISGLAKVINDKFTIAEALITTIHAYTAAQKLVDGPSSKTLRDGRSAPQNIIPSSTSAAMAVGKVLPELDGKLTGIAMIVPISSVSLVDLTCRVEKETSLEDIIDAIKEAANGDMKGILSYTEDEVVSNDMRGNPNSCVVDVKASIVLNKNFFKLVGWYDHQWAYSRRVLDMISYIDTLNATEKVAPE
ncbi:glyceraldehyde 3-phosphate dehydrogenase [Aaosphaeria arxii CBS 175.79]|uniref:Glyceraldehyde-3-phosphate dehydrogenase n=1 Tax=Aaosphaeria arxii CBS 175.79 TaxID=1450172 RepID=A0A6A5XSS5_9PLEO|nr:glyceraldehyde 3-phosphate dehydrogenase [Aaosphaeria arxii CBS 175.79]KAF2015740.1 glyceraldehyde 3-phosphate dehydrogenase [Aaosphaeria arxii CBS 175.79]